MLQLRLWAILALSVALSLALAGCGIDGPPTPPERPDEDTTTPVSGVVITGSASMGVTGGGHRQ